MSVLVLWQIYIKCPVRAHAGASLGGVFYQLHPQVYEIIQVIVQSFDIILRRDGFILSKT